MEMAKILKKKKKNTLKAIFTVEGLNWTDLIPNLPFKYSFAPSEIKE